MSDDATVAGRFDRSIADFIRACSVHLVEQQESIAPNNALIAVLCDSIRLAREHLAALAVPVTAPPSGWQAQRTILCSECHSNAGAVTGLFPQAKCTDCGRTCMGYGFDPETSRTRNLPAPPLADSGETKR
jgi:hypothetical protein